MNLEAQVPGNEVIEFLRSHGATHTDAAPTFPEGGRHQDNIISYVWLMEAGMWQESKRPIMLDAKTGTVWKGTDRCAAIAKVDWDNAPVIPSFHIIVEHPKEDG